MVKMKDGENIRLAYYFSCFPTVSTTFLQREVRALQACGIEPVLVANRPPAKGGFHPDDQALFDQTFYLTGVGHYQYIRANVSQFIKTPKQYMRAEKLAIDLKDNFPFMRLRNLARVTGAAVLAQHLAKKK